MDMNLKYNLLKFGVDAYIPVRCHYSMANMLIFLYKKTRTLMTLILNISAQERDIELIVVPL